MKMSGHFPRKLLALFGAMLLLPSGGALAAQVYPEQVGDAPGGAPDIASLSVSHKLAGEVRFDLSFANRATLTGEDFVALSLDSDQDQTTGDSGEDFWIGVSGGSPSVGKLFANFRLIILPAGTVTWMPLPLVDLPVTWSNGTMSLSFNKEDVGATKGLDFYLASHTGADMTRANTELVPHTGLWSYSLESVIETIQLANPALKVKAGKVFSVRGATVKLNTEEVFTPETLTAKATIAGKALKPLGGGLSWKVPKAAKGKKLVVTLDASYRGMQKTQVFTIKILK